MHEFEDKDIFSSLIKAVHLRDKYVVGGPSMHPLQQEETHPREFTTLALNELILDHNDSDTALTTPVGEPVSGDTLENPNEFLESPRNTPSENLRGNRRVDRDVAKLPFKFYSVDGVMVVVDPFDDSHTNMFPIPSIDEFYQDMDFMNDLRSSGPVQSFCFNRLQLIQTKFELHGMVHTTTERNEMKSNCHRDFYNVRKVDTHIHHSAAMNAKFLLRFIRRKARLFPNDVVMLDPQSGQPVTLGEMFRIINVEPGDLSLDKLNVLADKTTLHRFDRFNAKYSPMGEPMLRSIFLKTDNYMKGRYLAELTKLLLKELEESKYQHTEWRVSIYGTRIDEWDKLSKWVNGFGLISPNNRWMIQIPRLYNIYKKNKSVANFQQMLDNIFVPLFEVTIDPESHPELEKFLQQVSGFDTVDDESKSPAPVDRQFSSKVLSPDQWDLEDNPSYKYYSFYIYANIRVLNELRNIRGKRPLDYRPHAGETGEIHHLDTAFLLADGISHGINLRKSPALQYLFYISQIGLAVSPCSNNQLFISYDKNPFYTFFQRGLNVSLSTDDPLMFHQTKEPLMEEYSIAKQIYRLSQADTCEIARNSVLQSGYSDEEKIHWLGSLDRWKNDILKTNVPNIRIRFRHKTWLEEWLVLKGESEVMDSLVQFATQHLLTTGSPSVSRQHSIVDLSSIPVVDRSAGQPTLGKIGEDMEELILEETGRAQPRRIGRQNWMSNRPQSVNFKSAFPFWLSGLVVGGMIAIVIMDAKVRRT